MIDVGHYPISQCWYQQDEEPIHMIDRVDKFGSIYFRCGLRLYYMNIGSCVWTTSNAPTCSECIEWIIDYIEQLRLPFPNGHDRYGWWVYRVDLDYKELRQYPKWMRDLCLPKHIKEALEDIKLKMSL